MYSFKDKYGEYQSLFEARLSAFFEGLKCEPLILDESLKYSLKSGGKRIRPVLMLASADLLGVKDCGVEDFALALELIHTYSLIHDDLPEMDNDDYRRGRPSNHKVYGAGNAVLAGDGLLNSAYYLLFEKCAEGKLYADAAKFMCGCAGVKGMIAGQSADLYSAEKGIKTADMLDFIVKNKTGKLISAAVAVPAILAGGRYFLELRQFGEDLGRLSSLSTTYSTKRESSTKRVKPSAKTGKRISSLTQHSTAQTSAAYLQIYSSINASAYSRA